MADDLFFGDPCPFRNSPVPAGDGVIRPDADYSGWQYVKILAF
jgi:hypothetical protein